MLPNDLGNDPSATVNEALTSQLRTSKNFRKHRVSNNNCTNSDHSDNSDSSHKSEISDSSLVEYSIFKVIVKVYCSIKEDNLR